LNRIVELVDVELRRFGEGGIIAGREHILLKHASVAELGLFVGSEFAFVVEN
jgi:hypothetical protein